MFRCIRRVVFYLAERCAVTERTSLAFIRTDWRNLCTGPSMEPTLYTNDVLLMERLSVRLQRLEKGDIVISKCPSNPKQNICKRIVGLPGDKVRNGFNLTTIPYGHVWLEGDNSNNSTDSRIYGPVPQGLLRGRALCKIFPLREITLFTTKYVT